MPSQPASNLSCKIQVYQKSVLSNRQQINIFGTLEVGNNSTVVVFTLRVRMNQGDKLAMIIDFIETSCELDRYEVKSKYPFLFSIPVWDIFVTG